MGQKIQNSPFLSQKETVKSYLGIVLGNGQGSTVQCTLDIQSVFLKCGNLCAYMETQAFIAVYIHYTVSILYSMSPIVAARILSD